MKIDLEGCLEGCVALLAVCLFIGGSVLFLSGSVVYNTTRAGQHKGYVTAVEQGGIVFHNYNVYFKTDNSSSQEDIYCVQSKDSSLAYELRKASQDKTLVTIKYEGVRAIGLGLCSQDKITEVTE